MPNKKEKRKIYSYECHCGSRDCLPNMKAILKFQKKAKMKYYLDKGSRFHEASNLATITYTKSPDPDHGLIFLKVGNKAKTPCMLVRKYIELDAVYGQLLRVNHQFQKGFSKQSQEHDQAVIQCDKLKSVAGNALKSLKETELVLKTSDSIIAEQKREIKALNKKVKQMEKMMSKMKFDAEDSSDDSDSSDSDSGEKEPNPTEPDKPGQTEVGATTDEIMQRYETVKHYMARKNISLSQVCRRNDRARDPILKAFIALKCRRIDLAHPQPEHIENDQEFFQYLENISTNI